MKIGYVVKIVIKIELSMKLWGKSKQDSKHHEENQKIHQKSKNQKFHVFSMPLPIKYTHEKSTKYHIWKFSHTIR